MSACTCTNSLYERVRPPASLPHQPKSDRHPTTARASSTISSRPVRNKTVTLSKTKLSPCPEKSCHPVRNKLVITPDFGLIHTVLRPATEGLPATWPRCTKYQNSLPTVFFRPLTVRLPHPEHLPSNYFSPTTSSQAPNQPDLSPQVNLFYSETITLHSARCSRFIASSSAHPTGSTLKAFREVLGALF